MAQKEEQKRTNIILRMGDPYMKNKLNHDYHVEPILDGITVTGYCFRSVFASGTGKVRRETIRSIAEVRMKLSVWAATDNRHSLERIYHMKPTNHCLASQKIIPVAYVDFADAASRGISINGAEESSSESDESGAAEVHNENAEAAGNNVIIISDSDSEDRDNRPDNPAFDPRCPICNEEDSLDAAGVLDDDIGCRTCGFYYHLKCVDITTIPETWDCATCLMHAERLVIIHKEDVKYVRSTLATAASMLNKLHEHLVVSFDCKVDRAQVRSMHASHILDMSTPRKVCAVMRLPIGEVLPTPGMTTPVREERLVAYSILRVIVILMRKLYFPMTFERTGFLRSRLADLISTCGEFIAGKVEITRVVFVVEDLINIPELETFREGDKAQLALFNPIQAEIVLADEAAADDALPVIRMGRRVFSTRRLMALTQITQEFYGPLKLAMENAVTAAQDQETTANARGLLEAALGPDGSIHQVLKTAPMMHGDVAKFRTCVMSWFSRR